MLRRFFSKYVAIVAKAGRLSQVVSFLLAILSAVSLFDLLSALLRMQDLDFVSRNLYDICVAVAFHFLILATLSIRFAILFRNSLSAAWRSQLLWVVSLVWIYLYEIVTRGRLFDDPSSSASTCIDCFYFSTFRYATVTFTVVFISYPVISFLCEALIWIVAFFGSFEKRRA